MLWRGNADVIGKALMAERVSYTSEWTYLTTREAAAGARK
jgi:hypothetical protein